MVIVVVDKSLEVSDLDLLLAALTLEEGVQLETEVLPAVRVHQGRVAL
jgi:hypothetical protein